MNNPKIWSPSVCLFWSNDRLNVVVKVEYRTAILDLQLHVIAQRSLFACAYGYSLRGSSFTRVFCFRGIRRRSRHAHVFLSFRLGLRFNIYRLDITKLFLCLKKMATTNEAISSLEEAVRMLG